MNEIMIKQTLDSREVAEMMDTRHDNLIKKIDNINKDLTDLNFKVSEYWIEKTYKDASGKENRGLEITRKGCEFLANKTTGKKGNMFTYKYIERFHAMEEQLQETTIALKVKELENQVKKLEEVNKELEKSTQEAKSMMKLSHKNKLDFNRMIKSVVANKEEEKTLKAWVLAVNNAAQWQDIPVCKYQKVAQDILNIAPLVSTKTFEQLKLF